MVRAPYYPWLESLVIGAHVHPLRGRLVIAEKPASCKYIIP